MLLSTATLNQLGQETVLDEQGNAWPLGEFWREQKTVLIFIRHFG